VNCLKIVLRRSVDQAKDTRLLSVTLPSVDRFLPRDSCAKRGICRRRVSVCVSVCLSHSGIVSKQLNLRKQRRTIAPGL